MLTSGVKNEICTKDFVSVNPPNVSEELARKISSVNHHSNESVKQKHGARKTLESGKMFKTSSAPFPTIHSGTAL